MQNSHIIKLIVFSLAIKLIYFFFSCFVLEHSQNKTSFQCYINITKKNDTHWYQNIFNAGYPKLTKKEDIGYSNKKHFKQSEWAFFPFYPLLVKTTSIITGLDFDASAFLLSLFFSSLSIIGFYYFARIFIQNKEQAYYASLFLFLFPFAFYYSMLYTEAMFFSSMIFCFLTIYHGKYFLLALLLIPLVLLRPNGILLGIPLYLYHLEQKNILQNKKIDWTQTFSSQNIKTSIFFITGPITFLAYCLYQYKLTGYFFAFSIAQAGWYREFTFPIFSFFTAGDLSTQFNSIYTIITLLFAIAIHKKLPLSLNILIWISLLLPLCSGSVRSMQRFISILFPFFLILAQYSYKTSYRNTILGFIFSLHLLTYYFWLIDHPLSF